MTILDADKEYTYPDVEMMKRWFEEFNERFFKNELPPIELKVKWGHKNTLGGFRRPERKSTEACRPEQCSIELNGRFFETVDEWRNTMVHEMVHYYVYMTSGTDVNSHGKEFKAMAKRINAVSEFKIETLAGHRAFRPNPSITDHWGEHFDKEVILGSYMQTDSFDLGEEEPDLAGILIEAPVKNATFSFRTKSCYIPEIIDNMRNVRGEIGWFRADSGCQKLFLLPVVTSIPSFKPEDIIVGYDIFEGADSLTDFGPVKLTLLGKTEFRGDGVQGYSPGNRKEEFRRKYFRDADEIGRLAAESLVRQYREHSRWFSSTVHGTHDLKPACGEYTIQVDSRFKPLVGMTPKRILINPVRSETMMDAVRNLDTGVLASEIRRVILSRQ